MSSENRYLRILNASAEERGRLYEQLYAASVESASRVRDQLATNPRRLKRVPIFKRIIAPGHHAILEIGCGAGDLTWAFADLAEHAVGIDISASRVIAASQVSASTRSRPPAGAVKFLVMNAVQLGFANETFDCVVSTSMIEHLHPDDVDLHLAEVWRVLEYGGTYCVWCPNRLGHHDDRDFHLCMMSYAELIEKMTRAGFSEFRAPLFREPPMVGAGFKVALETLLSTLRVRTMWSHLGIRNICLVGKKTRNGFRGPLP